jgi:hypothetical protein
VKFCVWQKICLKISGFIFSRAKRQKVTRGGKTSALLFQQPTVCVFASHLLAQTYCEDNCKAIAKVIFEANFKASSKKTLSGYLVYLLGRTQG